MFCVRVARRVKKLRRPLNVVGFGISAFAVWSKKLGRTVTASHQGSCGTGRIDFPAEIDG